MDDTIPTAPPKGLKIKPVTPFEIPVKIPKTPFYYISFLGYSIIPTTPDWMLLPKFSMPLKSPWKTVFGFSTLDLLISAENFWS